MYKYRLTVQGLHHDNCYRIVPWHHFCVMLFAKIIWGHEIVNNVCMFSGSGKKIRIVASSLFVLNCDITGNYNSGIFILCFLYGNGFILSWWLSGDSCKQYYPRIFICSCTHSVKYLGNIKFKKYFMQSSLRQHVNQLFVTNYYVVNKHEGGRNGEGGRRMGGREGGSGC